VINNIFRIDEDDDDDDAAVVVVVVVMEKYDGALHRNKTKLMSF